MSDSRIKPGDTVYRVQHVSYTKRTELHVQTGTITPCGEWVDTGHARYPLGRDWHLRRCDAEASAARDLERHAMKCLAYARELRARAAT